MTTETGSAASDLPIALQILEYTLKRTFKRGKGPKTLELSFNDWRNMASDGWKRFPQAVAHLRRLDKLFNDFDKGQSGTLDFGEHRELLGVIDSKLTSQSATAQARQSAGRLPGQEAGIFAVRIGLGSINEFSGEINALGIGTQVVTADPDKDASDGLNQIAHLEDSDGRRGQHRRKQEVVLGANDSDMVIVRVQLFEQGNAASATTQYDQSRLVFHGSFRIGVIVVDQDVGNG
ncbi:alternative nadh dehydrogenase [Apiospora arundinis]|uniref:Alternative nadh dehydrogenase n=1 Tax=Apiospora arundinis TaxID=335852 RepID=A0ABR2IWW5_9PEZI